MEAIIKPGLTVKQVLIWNKTEEDDSCDYQGSICQLTFSDDTSIKYECKNVPELDKKNVGIYELLLDGTYLQIEDWESENWQG